MTGDSARRRALALLVGSAGGAVGLGALASQPTSSILGQSAPAGSSDAAAHTLFATDFFVGDGVTNCDAGLQRLHRQVLRRYAAGNTVALIWPAGRYVYTAMPNWAVPALHMHFQGEVWLINNGAGDALTFDGGARGAGVFGLKVTGFPRIYGTKSSGHGVFARAVYRSQFEIACCGAGHKSAGFHGEWLVSNEIRFSMNVNEGGLYSRPASGMFLTSRAGDPNFQSSYNGIYEPELSGLPVGLVLDSALGNKVFGGAFQANDMGLEIRRSGWSNKIFGADFESNQTDLSDNGRSTQIINCDFEKGPVFEQYARLSSMTGGECEQIAVRAGANRVVLSDVIYNRFGRGKVDSMAASTLLRGLRDAGGA